MDSFAKVSNRGGPYDRPDDRPTFELPTWLIEALQDDAGRLADREHMRERAGRTLDRILRHIVAGGAMALRPDDLHDIEADLGALVATGEGTVAVDLADTLIGMRARVTALLRERDAALAAIQQSALNDELQRVRRLGNRGTGGLGGT